MSLAGIEPSDFAVTFLRGIPQLEAYRGFWSHSGRHVAVGVVLGIDLQPSAGGYWYLESNLDLAQRPERTALYQRDPAVWNLLEFAREEGFRSLILLDSNSSGIDPKMAREYEEGAAQMDIDLTLVDRANVPRSSYQRSYGIPIIRKDDTLVVRMKSYPTSLDALFNRKAVSYRALARYMAVIGDPDLLLPGSGAEPVLAEISLDEPFPNVVYKLPELDQARGITFLKATSEQHARALVAENRATLSDRVLQERVLRAVSDDVGIYQQFVKPSLLTGRRPYIVRAHVLVSPAGVKLLSAHRVVSGRSIPETLEPGIVRDPQPYLVNFSAKSHYEVVPGDEQAQARVAATAAGRGLAWAAEQMFAVE